MFRTITAKYPGTCKRCGNPIHVGEKIRFGGKGRTYHFASVCADLGHVDVNGKPPVVNERDMAFETHAARSMEAALDSCPV